jgi:DNA-binding NarL/FixJ family response regulator
MRVLLLSKDRELGLLRAFALKSAGHHVIFPKGKDEAVKVIRGGAFEVAILTYTLSNETAIELHELIKQGCPRCRIVIVTQHPWAESKLEHDVAITGDAGPDALVAAVEQAQAKQPFLVNPVRQPLKA